MKKKQKKQGAKKIVKQKAKKYVFGGRKPSNKSKDSKVAKIKNFASKNKSKKSQKVNKKGLFGWLKR